MRLLSVLSLLVCLAACQHSIQSNEAVRQGVLDHLAKADMNLSAMDITVSNVQFKGSEADAAVTMTLKNVKGGMPMNFQYHLKQQDNKWVVIGRNNGGGHADSAAPAADNPHGGGAPPIDPNAPNPHGGGASQMPSPNDLPPATKK